MISFGESCYSNQYDEISGDEIPAFQKKPISKGKIPKIKKAAVLRIDIRPLDFFGLMWLRFFFKKDYFMLWSTFALFES